MKQNMLRRDRTAAERKMSLARPAAGGESCKQDSFVKPWKKNYKQIIKSQKKGKMRKREKTKGNKRNKDDKRDITKKIKVAK